MEEEGEGGMFSYVLVTQREGGPRTRIKNVGRNWELAFPYWTAVPPRSGPSEQAAA
ncbi:hypothetical protein [Amycolatopsis sp.]|uniref:hypothetical protein n=1 Tax=Amycolatopsis sp. TaxID=37632 RepID=UPI003458AE01